MMIDADLFLMNNVIGLSKLEKIDLYKDLLAWFKESNNNQRRKFAKNIITKIIEDGLNWIVDSDEAYIRLFNIFEPLEIVFRMAMSKEESPIREHLDHTIRDYLLSLFILKKLINSDDIDMSSKRLLAISTVFHDVAYPVEKLKAAARNIDLMRKFMDTEHRQEFELSDTEGLLDILDVIGGLEHKDYGELHEKVLCPAIAGKGLYETRHNLDSVVLFLLPISNFRLGNCIGIGKKNRKINGLSHFFT